MSAGGSSYSLDLVVLVPDGNMKAAVLGNHVLRFSMSSSVNELVLTVVMTPPS